MLEQKKKRNENLRLGTIELEIAGEKEREYLRQALLPVRGQTVTYLKANNARIDTINQEQASNNNAENSGDPSTPRIGTTHFALSSEITGTDIEDLRDFASLSRDMRIEPGCGTFIAQVTDYEEGDEKPIRNEFQHSNNETVWPKE